MPSGLTIIGNDEGAVLVDTTTGFPLQGCRSFSSTATAEEFLEWAAEQPEVHEDLRAVPAFEVSDLRDAWEATRAD